MTIERRPMQPSIRSIIDGSRFFDAIKDADDWRGQWEVSSAEALAEDQPEIVQLLAQHNIDGMHGASSLSIEGVLDHGLLTVSTIRELGITALGFEHHSQPNQRSGVHVVTWPRAGETIRYAELRVQPKTNDYVTPSNADFLAESTTSNYEHLPPSALKDHLFGLAHEAQAWQEQVNERPELQEYPFYPVVYGISSARLPEDANITYIRDSRVKGDVQVGKSIPREAITAIFAPTEHHAHLAEVIKAHEQNIATLPLEDLRTLNEAEYGYMLPRQPRQRQ